MAMKMVWIERDRWPVKLATLSQLKSRVGFEQAQLCSNFPPTRGVYSKGKSVRLIVVAMVNGGGEVMAVRDTQNNDGHDIRSTVRFSHLTPSP